MALLRDELHELSVCRSIANLVPGQTIITFCGQDFGVVDDSNFLSICVTFDAAQPLGSEMMVHIHIYHGTGERRIADKKEIPLSDALDNYKAVRVRRNSNLPPQFIFYNSSENGCIGGVVSVSRVRKEFHVRSTPYASGNRLMELELG